MAEETLKLKAAKGVVWKIGERGIRQLIQFGVSVILARLILPAQFGMIAMIGIFTSIASVFIDSGFGQALYRKTDRTQADCSTVYWFNVIISITCYIIIFFCAPFAADFYKMPEITAVLRVNSLSIVIGSFAGVHGCLLGAEMNFKAVTKCNLLGLIASAIVGVSMAYMGFQVWALVGQNLVSSVITTVYLFNYVKWRPSFMISKESFKEFFGFGSKMLASSLLDTVYGNIYGITIGKVYKAADLAYYNRSQGFLSLTTHVPTGILSGVTYPTLCKLQHDEEALRRGYRKMLRVSAFVIFPMCLGMGAVAVPLVNVFYTDVWAYAATLMTIMCFSLMWYPIHAINLNYLIVKGRSDLFFRLEVIKKIQGVIILCITVPLGLEAMCYGSIVSSLLCLIYNCYYTGKYLKMGILSQLRDFAHILALCAVMFVAARIVATLLGDGILSLACSVATGAVIYIAGAFLFRFAEIDYLKNIRK